MYNLQISRAIEEIKKARPRLVLIQLPEGLKKYALNISKQIESKTGAKTIISGEPCWGACDVADTEAKEIGADLILHFGHTRFTGTKTKTVYIPVEYKGAIKLSAQDIARLKKYKTITLLASIQYFSHLDSIKAQLPNSIIPKDPQVLGCKIPKIKTEAVVVVGDRFHALGVALEIEKPVFCLTNENKLEDLTSLKKNILTNNLYQVQKFRQAVNIGILVSTKSGQKNMILAEKIKKQLEADQKNAVIIIVREITPALLDNFYNIEAFINTACPRLSYDDILKFEKPIINHQDLSF